MGDDWVVEAFLSSPVATLAAYRLSTTDTEYSLARTHGTGIMRSEMMYCCDCCRCCGLVPGGSVKWSLIVMGIRKILLGS